MAATAGPLARPGIFSPVATALATGLGAGYSPVAPGTAGSVVGVLLFWPLASFPAGVQMAALMALFLGGVAASTDLSRRLSQKDPGVIVVDEMAGMWASLLFLPLSPAVAAAGFLIFRVMDVLKPYPARDLEELPRGWGIMADDLMAGAYANLTLRVLLLAWPFA